MSNVADLQEVDLREQWENEESDFTPWLADHISYLSEAVNIELVVQETEANVGGYYADIHATDIEGERDIIIENQYNSSDHKHLGQSLVYAGGFDADIVIWLAEEFNDPHIDAIQWFNQRTGQKTGFFAVKVGLVRIENSPVAPRFSVVERPSSWKALTGDLSQTEQEHLRFWKTFNQRLERRDLTEYKNGSSSRASYVVKRFDGAYIRLASKARGELNCTLRIEDYSGEFAGLERESVKKEFLTTFSDSEDTPISESEVRNVEWDSNPNNLYDKIVVHYSGSVDRSNETEWQKYCDWLIDTTVLFDEVFSSRF